MRTYSAVLASGSTNGVPLSVSGTALANATLLHTAGTGALDEIYLWVCNVTANAAKLTLVTGGVLAPVGLSVPPNSSWFQVTAGFRVNNGTIVKAYSDTADALKAVLNVNRIS